MNSLTVGNLLLVNIQAKNSYIPTSMLVKSECLYINGENHCRGSQM